MKTGKYDFERKIIALHFVKKTQVSLTYFAGSVADALYKFHFRASPSLYYRSPDGAAGRLPSGRSAAMENVAIAAI